MLTRRCNTSRCLCHSHEVAKVEVISGEHVYPGFTGKNSLAHIMPGTVPLRRSSSLHLPCHLKQEMLEKLLFWWSRKRHKSKGVLLYRSHSLRALKEPPLGDSSVYTLLVERKLNEKPKAQLHFSKRRWRGQAVCLRCLLSSPQVVEEDKALPP
eukprot:TRINITY_DN79772_c0_g1_i1.p1 TRINITY_DN79772_c0_g1~~TRINITY_DN79772_c0_g1_i1.p1  ORF type:complete len:154 (+),score=16.44 TRINITY_DN79772_c0_g1_i1:3805-4266(+)